MNIFLDGIIFTLQKQGGISVFWGEILRRMIRDEHSFSLLETDKSKNNFIRQKLNIATDKVQKEKKKPSLLFRTLPLTVPNESIFTSTYYRTAGKNHLRQVAIVYDLAHEFFIHGIRGAMHSWQKKRAISQAQSIIAISQSTKNDLLRWLPNLKEETVTVIYPGCSEFFFKFEQKPSLFQITEDPLLQNPFLVFIGERKPYKNFVKAVATVALMKEYSLAIVGGGPLSNSETQNLNKYIGRRYLHLNKLSNAELNLLYNNAQALLYPSSYEGFGLPVIESMAAGCPVVAVNTSSIPEAAGNAALLVDYPRPELLASKIRELEVNSVRVAAVRAGISNAKRFDWEISYSKMINIFKKTSK